jgi:hypothetical protein
MADRLVLLVEGKDEVMVLRALGKCRPFAPGFRVLDKDGKEVEDDEKVTIRSAEGIEKLRDMLPLFLRPGDCERLGVLVDADSKPTSRWTSITGSSTARGIRICVNGSRTPRARS